MTNRSFNFRQVQGLYKIDYHEYDGSFHDYVGGVAEKQGRINQNFGGLHLAYQPIKSVNKSYVH